MKRTYETCDLMHGNICVSEPCICKGMHMAALKSNKKGDVKICMTCGSKNDLIKCNSANLIRYECKKCRGLK